MRIIAFKQNLRLLPSFCGDGFCGAAHGLNVLGNLLEICRRRRAADDQPHIGAIHCGFGQKCERIARIITGDLPRNIKARLIRSNNGVTAFK